MLIPQKIGNKKLTIYIIIIVVMFGGMLFFIYKNYSSAFKKSKPTSQPGLNDMQKLNSPTGNQMSGGGYDDINKVNLDTKILDSSKFKNLKDNSIPQSIKSEGWDKQPL